jgi:hypothetical protein
MKIDWEKFIDRNINVTMNENYGVVYSPKKDDPPISEIVFKTGKLVESFDEGLMLESIRDNKIVNVFVPFTSIKCVEIY